MTKFYDGSKILEITLKSLKTGEDFSRDFFEDACTGKNYNEDLDAFRVDDVDYLVDYAKSYLDYDPENPDYDLTYSVEER